MCDALAVRKLIAIAALAALVTPACKASVNVNAKAKVDEPQEEVANAPAPQEELNPPPQATQTDYFGVARGLSLVPGRPAVCSCVAAAYGYPGDEAFKWRGVPPKVANDALVVAIGTNGVPCDKQGPGPSIHAIDRDGEDVIVVLEEWNQARPQALGAIIPNPGANGHIYLRGHDKKTIYGHPAGAGAGPHGRWCRIGQGTGAANTVVTPTQKVEDPQHASPSDTVR
ncbi:MAG: hypothetical protein HY898_02380 [Deltaproteobacteria bacterium]|nr:hypothetical protein [Deltaproteobacteria bacterium]